MISLTYIHHNCFVLDLGVQKLIFDIPGPSHLPEPGRRQLLPLLQERCIFFFSHAHEDHFDPDLDRLLSKVWEERNKHSKHDTWSFVFADDIQDLYPETLTKAKRFCADKTDVLVVEPDQEYGFKGIHIFTLESNDQGVAFLITLKEGKHVFFGGDLALWLWPEMSIQGRQATLEFYLEQLGKIKDKKIDLAFANVDKRLPNLAGAEELLAILKPQVFVPMHTFGHPKWIDELKARMDRTGLPIPTQIVHYNRPGDTTSLEI